MVKSCNFAPHKWVVGSTFEFSFTLPKSANRGNPTGRKNTTKSDGRPKETRLA